MNSDRAAVDVPCPNRRTPEEWAESINGAWHRTLEGVLETARLICAAQEALEQPEWMKTRSMLALGERSIDRLRDIGLDSRIALTRVGGVLGWDRRRTAPLVDRPLRAPHA